LKGGSYKNVDLKRTFHAMKTRMTFLRKKFDYTMYHGLYDEPQLPLMAKASLLINKERRSTWEDECYFHGLVAMYGLPVRIVLSKERRGASITFELFGVKQTVAFPNFTWGYEGAGPLGLRSVFFMCGIQQNTEILSKEHFHLFDYDSDLQRLE